MAFSMRDFGRLIDPIKNKIMLLIGRCILTAVDDSKGTQLIQGKGLSGEIISDIEKLEPYGFTSSPDPDAETEALIVCPNGNRDQAIAICVHDRENRQKNHSKGDVVIYGKNGNKIHLKQSGNIEITLADNLHIGAANESYVKGDTFKTELDKDVDALSELQSAMSTWTPVPMDGGAALKTAITTFLGLPMASTSDILSDKIKGE